MPKFLDTPSWYTTDGTLMSLPSGAPSQYLSTLKTNSDGTTKWEKPAVDSCNESVNGGAMIYAPTSAGDGTYQVLCGGMPTPTFRSLYLHCFSYKITGSNVIWWLTLSIIYPSRSTLTSAQITNKLSRFNDANHVYPASGGYIVPSIGTFERVTMITGIYWAGTYFAACGVRSNMYAENIFTFSPGSLTETGSYSISYDTM